MQRKYIKGEGDSVKEKQSEWKVIGRAGMNASISSIDNFFFLHCLHQ